MWYLQKAISRKEAKSRRRKKVKGNFTQIRKKAKKEKGNFRKELKRQRKKEKRKGRKCKKIFKRPNDKSQFHAKKQRNKEAN